MLTRLVAALALAYGSAALAAWALVEALAVCLAVGVGGLGLAFGCYMLAWMLGRSTRLLSRGRATVAEIERHGWRYLIWFSGHHLLLLGLGALGCAGLLALGGTERWALAGVGGLALAVWAVLIELFVALHFLVPRRARELAICWVDVPTGGPGWAGRWFTAVLSLRDRYHLLLTQSVAAAAAGPVEQRERPSFVRRLQHLRAVTGEAAATRSMAFTPSRWTRLGRELGLRGAALALPALLAAVAVALLPLPDGTGRFRPAPITLPGSVAGAGAPAGGAAPSADAVAAPEQVAVGEANGLDAVAPTAMGGDTSGASGSSGSNVGGLGGSTGDNVGGSAGDDAGNSGGGTGGNAGGSVGDDAGSSGGGTGGNEGSSGGSAGGDAGSSGGSPGSGSGGSSSGSSGGTSGSTGGNAGGTGGAGGDAGSSGGGTGGNEGSPSGGSGNSGSSSSSGTGGSGSAGESPGGTSGGASGGSSSGSSSSGATSGSSGGSGGGGNGGAGSNASPASGDTGASSSDAVAPPGSGGNVGTGQGAPANRPGSGGQLVEVRIPSIRASNAPPAPNGGTSSAQPPSATASPGGAPTTQRDSPTVRRRPGSPLLTQYLPNWIRTLFGE